MPYITKERAKMLDKYPKQAENGGELNYLYTKEYVKLWKYLPKYSEFHFFSISILKPDAVQSISILTKLLLLEDWDARSLLAARWEAVAEFRRRVMSKYEDKKRKDKKNIDPYKGIKIT